MRLVGSDHPLMLSYRGGDKTLREPESPTCPPGPLGPILSTIPGLFCWLLFASAAMPRELPILERLADLFGGRTANGVVLFAWGVALLTSLVTLAYYARRPQAW